MRPERSMKHPALQGGDQWKKKLIQHPQTYEGSFADADMQQFRPYPNPNPMDDPWVQSRLPDQPMGGMQMQMQDAYAANDELTRIKMRNRRFQQSVAADQGLYGPPMPPAQLRGAGCLRCQRRADQDQDEEPSVPAVRGCRPGPVRASNASGAAEGCRMPTLPTTS